MYIFLVRGEIRFHNPEQEKPLWNTNNNNNNNPNDKT